MTDNSTAAMSPYAQRKSGVLKGVTMLGLEFSKQQLCMNLLQADTEEQVIHLLREEGYWDDRAAWRPFGNREDNFSTIGNQSSSADGALVEKLVNSVDAVLMGECWMAGMSPNSTEAPRSILEAVAQFFFEDRSKANTVGHVSNWDQQRRRQVSDRITLSATGTRRSPSFTIVDNGEGQTPESMPDTFLSLDKQNKIDVHFVQGKFNMGGTGALRFCGRHNLQLIISRRDPRVPSLDPSGASSDQWGFTVVRREDPTDYKRVSTYTYLAPEPIGILRFDADVLPLFPEANRAYARNTGWGTAAKLYEYKLTGRSHILRGDGLLQRLDLLLPRIALPIRLHECRDYRGHPGSFDTTLNGLGVRLSDDRSENLEPGFPTSTAFTIHEEPIIAEVYAFKRGKADTYRKHEGIIFTVNGQTHGTISRTFFSRKAVQMDRLEDSILVIVECSRISGRRREDLFMNSRDRMEQGEFFSAIEIELESTLKDNHLLRALRERRRREDVASKLQDSKPLRDVLESILRKSPSLAALFGGTGQLSDPFKSKRTKPGSPFLGKQHPTIFRFRDLGYGAELKRTTAANMRSRIVFETDVVNDYFSRSQYAGGHFLRFQDQDLLDGPIPNHTLNLQDGVATLNLALPDGASVGDSFRYELVVRDETLVEPFLNRFVISVGLPQEQSGGNGIRRPRFGDGDGLGETFQGLAVPTAVPVYEQDWWRYGFDQYSALRVIDDSSDEGGAHGNFTYYINMDNVYLNTELKATKDSPEIVKSRWQYGMVLIGLAMLRDQRSSADITTTPQEEAAKVAAAVAPVMLPLIEHLGALSEEDVAIQN